MDSPICPYVPDRTYIMPYLFVQKSPCTMSSPYAFVKAGAEICHSNNEQKTFLPKTNHQLDPSNIVLRFWLAMVQWHNKINHRYSHHDQWGNGLMGFQKSYDDSFEFCRSRVYSTIYLCEGIHPLTSRFLELSINQPIKELNQPKISNLIQCDTKKASQLVDKACSRNNYEHPADIL